VCVCARACMLQGVVGKAVELLASKYVEFLHEVAAEMEVTGSTRMSPAIVWARLIIVSLREHALGVSARCFVFFIEGDICVSSRVVCVCVCVCVCGGGN
jgi:hypothetical protein